MIAWLLASRLFGPVASVLAVIFLAATVTQCAGKHAIDAQFKHAEAARVVAVNDLAQCKTNLAQVSAAADEQSAAVDAYRADAERRLAAAQDAVKRAQAGTQRAARTSTHILALTPGADMCASAYSVLKGNEG